MKLDYQKWLLEMEQSSLDFEQIGYLAVARAYVDAKHVSSVKELQELLGFGFVDEAMLKDTFFKD